MKTKSRVLVFAAIACALAMCLALVGCGSGSGSKSDIKKDLVGTWELTEMSDTTADDIELMKSLGLNVELTFAEGGVFKWGMFGEVVEGTWEASDASKIAIKADGGTMDATLKDGKLSFTADGDSMTFKKTSDDIKDLTVTSE